MQIMVEEVAWWFREKTAEIDLHDYLANFGINPNDENAVNDFSYRVAQ